MNNQSFRLFLCCFFLLFAACNQNPNKERHASELRSHLTLSKSELLEDLKVLVTSLEEIHPNLYRVNSKEKIDNRIEQIRQTFHATDSLSYLAFLKLTAPLLTEIGCSNTQWSHSKAFIEFRNQHIPLFLNMR